MPLMPAVTVKIPAHPVDEDSVAGFDSRCKFQPVAQPQHGPIESEKLSLEPVKLATEEPGGLQSMGSQRVRDSSATKQQ